MEGIEKNNIGKESSKNKCKKVKSHRIDKYIKRCLIVENMQNCFFTGGSMGFKKKQQNEKEFIDKVNKLISLHEEDPKYSKASKSGRSKKKMLGGVTDGIETGSRKKIYFDIVIFTQDGNPPDHWTFASHHYLRNSKKFDHFSGSSKEKSKTYKCKGKRCKKKTKILLPEHALTDGTDRYKVAGKERIGIEFHPDLDIRSLYRPNKQFCPEVFIGKPEFHNRGFILFKGSIDADEKSAFKNSLDQSTGLKDFLECNNINSVFFCGMGRETSIQNGILSSIDLNFIYERFLIYDATRPIGIDYMGDKDVYKESIVKNKFVEDLRSKKVKVVNLDDLLYFVSRGETIHDKKPLPQDQVGKALTSLETLF